MDSDLQATRQIAAAGLLPTGGAVAASGLP
jgi:hypothetical protein